MLCVTIFIILNVTVYNECCRIWSAIINCAPHCSDVEQNGSKRQTVFVLKDCLEIAWDLNLNNRSVATDWQELSSRVLSFEVSSDSFCFKSTYCCWPKWEFKGDHVDKLYHPLKGYSQWHTPILTGRKKLLWIQTCPVVRKNSAENLAYVLVQSRSSKLPTSTTVVKRVLCATGGPHGGLLKN